MRSERIEQQYRDAQELSSYLLENGEVTFASYLDNVYKKALLLSVASFFEHEISSAIIRFAQQASDADNRVAVFVEKKAVSRQYHTYFQWNMKNSNAFWGLFGDETKNKVRKYIDKKETIKQGEMDFLELGNIRNCLVHDNYSEYDVNMTVEDIYRKYKSACFFIDYILAVLSPGFINGK